MYVKFIIYKMGIRQFVDVDTIALKAKYLNRDFTKDDFLNPDIFEINEFKGFLISCGLGYSQCDLVIFACQVVNKNEGFTVKLHSRICVYETIVYIRDSLNNCEYELSHCYTDLCRDQYELRVNSVSVPYVLNHISQIQMYFDLKK